MFLRPTMISMLRPSTILALPALALAACFGAGPVLGQSQDRSFWSRPSPSQSSSTQPTGPVESNRADARTDEAARLYADARGDLETGQYAAAQRRLEVLVARYPASPLADVARRDLQRLYAGVLGAPQPPATAVPATRSIQLPEQPRTAAPVTIQPPRLAAGLSSGPPPGGPPSPGLSSGVIQVQPSTAPVASTLQDAGEDFRHLAGDRIFFADSSIDLGGRAKSALEAQAAWLMRNPGIDVAIEGHSDDHGTREFNNSIAEKRAYAVKLRLNDLGVPADRISVVTFGRDRPVAGCAEPHCTAQNRRVVTTITRVPPGQTFDITRGSDRNGPDRNAGVPVR
jgi:peptidoglycan-associated lipoprotein